MTQRAGVASATKPAVRPKNGGSEDLVVEGFGPMSGEFLTADKVEEVLETLNLAPAAPGEDRLEPTPAEFEAAADEDEEPIEESLSPEDPVRLYLREIGRIALLTSEQEVDLGQRIERGQERVRRAVMAVPMVRWALMNLAERLRRREAEPDQFLEALDGTELTESELKRVLGVFTRIHRLDRELDELEASRGRARKTE